MKGSTVPHWSRQLAALRFLVSYIEREAGDLAIAGEEDPGFRYVCLDARLAEWTPIEGPRISRAIYISPSQPKRKRDRMVVRQLEWKLGDDFERAQTERVSWPSIAADCYDVEGPARKSIELALRELEQAVAPGSNDTIAKPTSSPGPNAEGGPTAPRRKRRSIFLHVGSPISIVDLIFREGDVRRVDSAWTPLWTQLSEICASTPSPQQYDPQYLVPPSRLARFLEDTVAEPE